VPSHRELTVEQQAMQLLNRAAFGPRPGDLAAVEQAGTDEWLERQLHPDDVADGALDAMISQFPLWKESPLALAEQNPPQDVFVRNLRRARGVADNAAFVLTAADSAARKVINDRANALANQFQAAKIARAQRSERQLLEVMTDFWENHFSVYAGKMPTRFTLLEWDRDVIRPHALGRFRDLLGAVAHSPAMLYYLDNWQSVGDTLHLTLPEYRAMEKAGGRRPVIRRRGGLNENYGRELLELHTLGVDGGYTQRDVIEVARALTGWTIQNPREGGGFVFREGAHDAEEKVVLGHRLTRGRGEQDGEEVLDIVSRHPATARFIAFKLARRFVTDTPGTALVTRAAETFRATDGDIRAVLRTILTSPEFYARAAYRAKVKSPFELVVSARRILRASPDTTPRTAQAIARLGQPLFGKLTPNGWPETGDQWVNAGSLIDRINFGLQLSQGRLPGAPVEQWPAWATLEITSLDRQVDGVVEHLLGGDASGDTRRVLLSGQNPLVRAGSTRPTLRDLVGLALGSPEFQRR
jgi:uncharacterized protein (DUF1800 family)